LSDSDAASPDDDATAATKREGSVRTVVDAETPDREEDRLSRGTLVGRYVVMHTLGAGGMGVVYSAFDPELDRKVAIKLLQALPGGSESGGQTWLLREAQAMARLAHPNVVAVYDVGEMPGDRVFLAMELVEGVSLRAWLRQKRTWREIVAVMRAAGAGLAAAHAAGLVHRDFKPDNVLVGNDGRTRVMDFGLARLHGSDEHAARTSDLQIETKSPLSERLTAAGTVLGTPAYMAPEIYRGQATDARADQFAFGVALYEALYHTRPFDKRALVEQRATAPKPPARTKVPAWLERVVLRALALDPAQRFATMDAMLVALGKDPTANRRRVAIGAAVLVACVGGVVGAVELRQPAAAPNELCSGATAKLAGVWDAPTRGALETAFHKIHKPFIDDAIRGTEKTLDTYATHWSDMQTEACKSTRVYGTQSEDVLTLRMQCLDNRLVELRTLVGLFGAADELLALGAVTSSQKLSSLGECADVAGLLAPDPLPKDPNARQQIAAVQSKLAEARALKNASRPKDALAITTAVAADATRLGHLPTEAMQHLFAGEMMWILQGAAHGEPELLKAAWTADAGKADETKVEAWVALTNLATEQSHFEIAMERWEEAAAALTRLGNNWELHIRVLASHALLESRQSHYDAAIAIAKQARGMAEPHLADPTYAYALLVEASILNASGHAQEALDDFKKVLAYQDALGHRRIEVAVTLQSMATAELQLGQLDAAVVQIRSAIEIDEAIYGPESEELARTLGALAAAQSMTSDLAGALTTAERALAMTERTSGQNADFATVLGQIADLLVNLKRPKEALPYLDHALAIQTAKLGPGHVQTLTLVLTKCDALHAANQLTAAIDVCGRALAAGEKSLGRDNPMLFLFLAHTGIVLQDAKQARKASAMFDRALELGTTDPSDVYYVAMLDARALWDAHDRKRAVDLAHKARDGFAKLGDAKRDQAHDADEWLRQHAL
jgi:tetratricopeptide (TPR) repeat protein